MGVALIERVKGPCKTLEGLISAQYVDAWMRHDKFGFAVEIKVPANLVNFSISMDFQGSNSFNMQTWNLEYWNFYRGNSFVVLHSKQNPVDLEDRFSKLVIVEGLSVQKYRKELIRL